MTGLLIGMSTVLLFVFTVIAVDMYRRSKRRRHNKRNKGGKWRY